MSVEGNLREMNVADLIQHNCSEGTKTRITFRNEAGDSTGIIFIEDGQIMHAELGSQEGEEAVYSLLAWDRGTFRQDPDVPAPVQTIQRSITGILLEGMRRIDEQVGFQSTPYAAPDDEGRTVEIEKDEPDDSPWSDLLQSTRAIEGVQGTVIAARDGIVIAHDIEANPEKEGAVVVYIGHAASQVEQVLKDSLFQWGRVKIGQENILVISRPDYYIGLFLNERASPALVAAQVQEKLG